MDKKIYFDNAATTMMSPEVLEGILPYFTERYGNPSSVYEAARASKKAVEDARARVACAIGAKPAEIFFTGGGTEADNWALIGTAFANRERGRHIITSRIEHHAVLHTCDFLQKNGFEVTLLPVDEFGFVSPEELRRAIREDTILVTIMLANNEIGTIQPVKELAEMAREHGIPFHTDAVQAVGHIPVNVEELGVDMLTLSAHKLYGPKGVGALYIRRGTKINSLIHGGAQEKNRRAGTENVPGIVGLGIALEQICKDMEAEAKRLVSLRDRLIRGILDSIPYARLNGHPTQRLPGNVNISFEFVEGESILLLLDMKGIFASSGSACTSGSLDPSHVLLAIGLPHEKAHGSLRLTLGRYNTEEEADVLLRELPPVIARLRDMSPLYEQHARNNQS